jgi:hypothetical protein
MSLLGLNGSGDCCLVLHRFVVRLGVRGRLRGQGKLIVQHLLVSENVGEEMDNTVV